MDMPTGSPSDPTSIGWLVGLLTVAGLIGAALREPLSWFAKLWRHQKEESAANEARLAKRVDELREWTEREFREVNESLASLREEVDSHHDDLAKFRTEVAKELATKQDLRDAVTSVKEHVSLVIRKGVEEIKQ